MNLHKVHNLPALHPDLGVQFLYILDGKYLAISKYELYTAITIQHDFRIYMATNGCLYMFNQALYYVETLVWCVYAFYISERESIHTVDSKICPAYMAIDEDDYL